jgi:type II secretory ATPase GspE/PulE/Tfp pilus assembly ATPase PilB-like protein
MTTVHASDSTEVAIRLRDMGVPEYLLRATLSLSVSQRLVRRVCTDCRRIDAIGEYARALFRAQGLVVPPRIAEASGCTLCGATGYRGRTAVFELLCHDPTTGPSIRHRSMLAAGLERVAALDTTVAEVLARCPDPK